MNRIRSGCSTQEKSRLRLTPSFLKKGLLSSLLPAGLLIGGCAGAPSTLDPKGPGAAEILFLWQLMFWLATAVFVAVMGLLAWGLFRPRTEPAGDEPYYQNDRRFVVIGGLVIPLIILLILYVFSFRSMAILAPLQGSPEVVIEVTGRQWWWEVHYPQQEITTANEIYIPVGQPVRLEVASGDVIHSFWVPALHGKIDMIPGQTNTFEIEAGEAGAYYGECAEFCGIQHAKMAFYLVAVSPTEFDAWIERQQQPAAAPESDLARRGRQIFLETNCAECHTLRNINPTISAAGEIGPDLTHVGSRLTLGAGILENNPENLAEWLLNPQAFKPGNLMPVTELTAEEQQALVAYLESLK